MQIVYYDDETPNVIKKSIFLAGCSVRSGQDIKSWRADALKILEDIGFDDGTIFIPENKDGYFDENHNYEKTVQWEEKHLNLCDCIMFWMPRKMDSLPGMTSNVEFGRYEQSPKLVLGYPEDAEKMRYLQYYADKYNVS